MSKKHSGLYREIQWSKWVLLARKRHERDLERARTDSDYPYYFSEKEADRVIKFFKYHLKHSKGKQFAGQAFEPSDWQEFDILRPLFGWLRKSDDQRRFRRVLIFIPRKNGKSTLVAGIALYLLIADCEPAAEIYCAATKEKQARIVFDEARRMLKKSSELSALCLPPTRKEIRCEELDSILTVLGRDSDTNDGWNVHSGIIDEYHAHKDHSMLEVLASGTGARDQPLIAITSTAGFNNTSPLVEEVAHGKRVLLGEVDDDESLIFIAEPDDPEAWQEPISFEQANPNIDISVTREFLQNVLQKAIDRPAKRNDYKVKHLNLFTSGETSWVDVIAFREQDDDVDWNSLTGHECVAALDVGRTQDMTAIALAFRSREGARVVSDGSVLQPSVFLQMHYWIPGDQDLVQKSKDDQANYHEWIELGLLRTTPGPVTVLDYVENDFLELAKKFKIKKLVADGYQAVELLQRLREKGIEVQTIPQTATKLGFGVKSFEELVISKRLKTNRHKILEWNIHNAKLYTDGNNNQKILKDKSKFRVDGAVAGAMAIGELLAEPAPIVNPYNTRGIYVG